MFYSNNQTKQQSSGKVSSLQEKLVKVTWIVLQETAWFSYSDNLCSDLICSAKLRETTTNLSPFERDLTGFIGYDLKRMKGQVSPAAEENFSTVTSFSD